jgi:hypothetical protein
MLFSWPWWWLSCISKVSSKRVERTLNYIYPAVQMNNNYIQATREEVCAVSDLIVSVCEEGAAAAE